jgi:hypothetical protein
MLMRDLEVDRLLTDAQGDLERRLKLFTRLTSERIEGGLMDKQ